VFGPDKKLFNCSHSLKSSVPILRGFNNSNSRFLTAEAVRNDSAWKVM
jgi:hypothetical protein